MVGIVLGGWLGGEAAYTVHVMRPKAIETMETVQTTADKVHGYVVYQLDEFQSEAYQRRVKQGFEVGRDASITIAKFNRTVIPEMAGLLRDVRANQLPALQTLMLSVDAAVRHSDESINQVLIPRIAAIADALKLRVDDLAAIINSLNLTAVELTSLAKNPDIPAIISQMRGVSENLNATSGHFNDASGSFAAGLTKFPDLMDSFQKYARASTKYQKWLYVAMIVRQLAAIPLRLP